MNSLLHKFDIKKLNGARVKSFHLSNHYKCHISDCTHSMRKKGKQAKCFHFLEQRSISKTVRDLCEISIQNDALCVSRERRGRRGKIFLKTRQVMKTLKLLREVLVCKMLLNCPRNFIVKMINPTAVNFNSWLTQTKAESQV